MRKFQGLVERVKKEWRWYTYAQRILDNVMQNRAAGWSRLDEEKEAIKAMLVAIDGKEEPRSNERGTGTANSNETEAETAKPNRTIPRMARVRIVDCKGDSELGDKGTQAVNLKRTKVTIAEDGAEESRSNEKDAELTKLKRTVRLVVEHNLEERANNKKVTVGGCS